MASNLTYFITGANRGLGKGFVTSLLKRPNINVIAAARDPAAAGVALNDLPEATLHLQKEFGITSIDVVIANAGVYYAAKHTLDNDLSAFRDHFNINTTGVVALFQGLAPLLKASKRGNPKFIALSSTLGSHSTQKGLAGLTIGPYGASKAALNWIIQKVHYEEPWLTTFVINPGYVMMDMFVSSTAELSLVPAAMDTIPVEVSVEGILGRIDSATREIGGTFQNYDGTALPW
ncbi:hypothetical protein CEP53_008636 [Fusarium sp. AF-6]|nr:hypothetical protein CEP53_008636 [Fusarium sp. AF-6]